MLCFGLGLLFIGLVFFWLAGFVLSVFWGELVWRILGFFGMCVGFFVLVDLFLKNPKFLFSSKKI